jgi:hypothetical protein
MPVAVTVRGVHTVSLIFPTSAVSCRFALIEVASIGRNDHWINVPYDGTTNSCIDWARHAEVPGRCFTRSAGLHAWRDGTAMQ